MFKRDYSQGIGRHCATVARDACRFRNTVDQEIHTVVTANGINCRHTHNAWEPCYYCQILTELWLGKHRQEPAKDGKVSV